MPTLPDSAPLVGREALMGLLAARLASVLDEGLPCAVTLTGAAGVGKSRLLDAFLAQVHEQPRKDGQPPRVLKVVAQPNAPPHFVIGEILRAWLGTFETEDPTALEPALRKLVAARFEDQRADELTQFLGVFLGLRLPESPLVRVIAKVPGQRGMLARLVLRQLLELEARQVPLILVIDDVHVADDDSLAVLQELFTTLRRAPILWICAGRHELLARETDWLRADTGHCHLEVYPLELPESQTLVRALTAPAAPVPQALVDAAVEMAGGNPYLIGRVVRAIVDSGTLVSNGAGGWQVNLACLDHVRLPLTVAEAIEARIGALSPPDRQVLEMASIMGGVFWLGGILALQRSDQPAPEHWVDPNAPRAALMAVLETLVARDYVMRLPDSSLGDDEEYAFKHNLEREAIARAVPRQRLRQYHLTVAEWLQSRLVARSEPQCEQLAQHFEAGGVPSKAADFYLAAADQAAARFAHAKAAQRYARTLALLEKGQSAQRTQALYRLGKALFYQGRYTAARKTYDDLRQLAFRLDLKARGAAAHRATGELLRELGQEQQALQHLQTAHLLYAAASDPAASADCLLEMAMLHHAHGRADAAAHLTKEARSYFEGAPDPAGIARCQRVQGLLFAARGEVDAAQQHLEQACTFWRDAGDMVSAADALVDLGRLRGRSGEMDRARACWSEARALHRGGKDRYREARMLLALAEAEHDAGLSERAAETWNEAAAVAARLSDGPTEAAANLRHGEVHLAAGRAQDALALAVRAISLLEPMEDPRRLGRALQLAATAQIATGTGPHDVVTHLERAIQNFEQAGDVDETARTCRMLAGFLVEREAEVTDAVTRSRHWLERAQALGKGDDPADRVQAEASPS